MTTGANTNPRTASCPSNSEIRTVTTIFAFLTGIGLVSVSWTLGLGLGYLVRGVGR